MDDALKTRVRDIKQSNVDYVVVCPPIEISGYMPDSIDSSLQERVLGVEWNVQSDEFRFTVSLAMKPRTRRGLLSTVNHYSTHWGLLPLLYWKRVLSIAACANRSWNGMKKCPRRVCTDGKSGCQVCPSCATCHFLVVSI